MNCNIEYFIVRLKKEIYAELVGCCSDEHMYAYENVIHIIDKIIDEIKIAMELLGDMETDDPRVIRKSGGRGIQRPYGLVEGEVAQLAFLPLVQDSVVR